jgi:hypothetical protein
MLSGRSTSAPETCGSRTSRCGFSSGTPWRPTSRASSNSPRPKPCLPPAGPVSCTGITCISTRTTSPPSSRLPSGAGRHAGRPIRSITRPFASTPFPFPPPTRTPGTTILRTSGTTPKALPHKPNHWSSTQKLPRSVITGSRLTWRPTGANRCAGRCGRGLALPGNPLPS